MQLKGQPLKTEKNTTWERHIKDNKITPYSKKWNENEKVGMVKGLDGTPKILFHGPFTYMYLFKLHKTTE